MYYFSSDIHLGGGSAERSREVEQRFVAWLDRAARDAKVIVLAGDVFDFWFEYREVIPKGFVRTLGKLAELTDRGIRVIFLTGNHDMWVGDYLSRECGVEIYTSPQLFNFGGQRILVAHGDNINIKHLPTLRLLNSIFRSKVLYFLFSWLVHPDLAMRFGHWWSGKSRKSHHVQGPPETCYTESLINYARTYVTENGAVDCCVFGHFHIARDYREVGLHTIHLGTWNERGGICAVLDDQGTIRLQNSDEL